MSDTGSLRPSLPKFTSEIIDREEVRRMIESRDQVISVQAECMAKQRSLIMSLYAALIKMRRTMYSDQSEESVMADKIISEADSWFKGS